MVILVRHIEPSRVVEIQIAWTVEMIRLALEDLLHFQILAHLHQTIIVGIRDSERTVCGDTHIMRGESPPASATD